MLLPGEEVAVLLGTADAQAEGGPAAANTERAFEWHWMARVCVGPSEDGVRLVGDELVETHEVAGGDLVGCAHEAGGERHEVRAVQDVFREELALAAAIGEFACDLCVSPVLNAERHA